MSRIQISIFFFSPQMKYENLIVSRELFNFNKINVYASREEKNKKIQLTIRAKPSVMIAFSSIKTNPHLRS